MAQTITKPQVENKATRETQKQEALARMKLLGLPERLIEDYEKHGKIYLFAYNTGYPKELSPEQLAEVREFERINKALVYAVIRQESLVGIMESLIIVSAYPEDWEEEKADIDNRSGYLFTYTINRTYPSCSEYGSITYRRTKDGLVRIG